MESKKDPGEEKTPSEDSPVTESRDADKSEPAEDAFLKEVEKAQNELLYVRAEFDNYKKRMLREQDQNIRFANEKIIRELLSVVDLMERALPHGENLSAKGSNDELGNFINGIKLTYRELTQILNRFGVELIGTIGEKFDPIRHEAISQVEGLKEKAGTVTEVLQKGSLLNGRLLKPAKVVVSHFSKGSE